MMLTDPPPFYGTLDPAGEDGKDPPGESQPESRV